MGKKYFCEYCNKNMNASPSIVKKHKQGLVHQKLLKEHYQQYKDPETILMEESQKKPCIRFLKGECQFGAICHYSHYTPDHIIFIQQQVTARKNAIAAFQQPSFQDLYEKLQIDKLNKIQDPVDESTIIYDDNGVTHGLPWIYNTEYDNFGKALPPSLKKIDVEDFTDIEICEWG